MPISWLDIFWLLFSKVHLLKSKNQFGKLQSDIDLAADEIIFKHLKESGVVFGAASEEKPTVSIESSSFDFWFFSSTLWMKMAATSWHSTQSTAPLSSTATSPLDLSTVFGKLKSSKARPEDPSLVPLWPFTELEPLFASSTLKTTKWKNWLWWKLEAKRSGSCQTHTSP